MGAKAFLPIVVLLALPGAAPAQSLATSRPSGLTISPAFEGWYKNPDGTYSISFGYLNRNTAEVVDIPVGPDNFVAPGNRNQGQPTQFQPRRNWGVFTVKVPKDFGRSKVVWTLKFRGDSVAIPGSLDPLWEIDALEGEAGSNNTPPALKFEESGAEGRGPGGLTSKPLSAKVGVPLALTVWSRDDARSATAAAGAGGRGGEAMVMLAWFKHQGPGTVTFAPPSGRAASSGAKTTTMATFSEPGEYIIRVRAHDSANIAGAGHEQCCWTNGFLRITVTR